MPTYQYTCTECGQSLEAVQSFSDAALTECPACQGKLRKVFNSVGIVFKGSGFYRTDSRSGTVGAENGKADAAPKSDTATKTDGAAKSDSSNGAKAGGDKGSSSAPASSSNGSSGATKTAATSSSSGTSSS